MDPKLRIKGLVPTSVCGTGRRRDQVQHFGSMEPVCPSQSAAWNQHKGVSPPVSSPIDAATVPTTNPINNAQNRI
jgi:hypothetical protein